MLRNRTAQRDWFDLSTLKEPYRPEGKKTMGYELAEQFSWELPEVVVYPTGGGTGLIGMLKSFAEMYALGWVQRPFPRMVVVQAEGCAPMVHAAERVENQFVSPGRIFSAIDYLTKCGFGICGACHSPDGRRICVDGPFLPPAVGG